MGFSHKGFVDKSVLSMYIQCICATSLFNVEESQESLKKGHSLLINHLLEKYHSKLCRAVTNSLYHAHTRIHMQLCVNIK